MKNFKDFLLKEETNTGDIAKVDSMVGGVVKRPFPKDLFYDLENMLKPYNTGYHVSEDNGEKVVKVGLFKIRITKEGYVVTKGDKKVGIYKTLQPIEKMIEDEFLNEGVVSASWDDIFDSLKGVKTSVGVSLQDELKLLKQSLIKVSLLPSAIKPYINEAGLEIGKDKEKINKIIDLIQDLDIIKAKFK